MNESEEYESIEKIIIPEEEQVVDDYDEVPEESPPTAEDSMRYFGVDFDVYGLVRRLNDKDLVVPSFDPSYTEAKSDIEGFQRRFVWPKKHMDRFVESLLLGYPVPGIFLLERPNRKLLVLDGQQRLKTLQSFYSGIYTQPNGKDIPFELQNVGNQFKGKTYASLSESDRRLLDSTVLQSTIVVPKEDNLKAVYLVFERINNTGIKLHPQEIRVALYPGELINLLRDLNATPHWRELFGAPNPRLKDHEIILRYLLLVESAIILDQHNWDRDSARSAQSDASELYKTGMASSLNSYLENHRDLQGLDADAIKKEFLTITKLLAEGIGKPAIRPRGKQINAAHTDALLASMAVALRKGVALSAEQVASVNDRLLKDDVYLKSILESTALAESVFNRLSIAGKLFTEK